MGLIVQCISHKDKTYVNSASSITVRVQLPTFLLVMFFLASFHLLSLYFWRFYNYGSSFMVVTAPAFFARKKVLPIMQAKVAEGKNASIMNDVKAVLVSVTSTGSFCFLSNSISCFVIYIINEECLVIFNQQYFVLLLIVTIGKLFSGQSKQCRASNNFWLLCKTIISSGIKELC